MDKLKLSCDNFINGVFGRRGALLDRVGASCDSGLVTDVVGKARSKYFTASCPEGHVITGFRGGDKKTRKHPGIGALELRCENIDRSNSNLGRETTFIKVLSN